MKSDIIIVISFCLVISLIFILAFTDKILTRSYNLKMAELGMSQTVNQEKIIWVKSNEK
jgi:hypothetical protein